MSFTALPRGSNFNLNALKNYLALYPEIENDLAWRNITTTITWKEAKNALEEKKSGYKRTYYQQAVIWGLEDRSNDLNFDFQRYLLMFKDDEQLEKYCQFWFQIYYAPNLHVKFDAGEKPIIIYTAFAKRILESDIKRVKFLDVLSEICGEGKSEDIVLNCFKDWGFPIKCDKQNDNEWYLFVEKEDVEKLKELIERIEKDFPVNEEKAFDEHYYFNRFSYKNFAKFWHIGENDPQFDDKNNLYKLPQTVRDCAKAIVDYIYKIDGFAKINSLFEVNDKSIKINTVKADTSLPNGNFLRYMFALPLSDMYENETRVFKDEYNLNYNGQVLKCRLTTQWKGPKVELDTKEDNYLDALIAVVNKYYADSLIIREAGGCYYLCPKGFTLKSLPKDFQTDFSRRYITSLLAKPFVILTGNSGTGKTRIAKQFAEYLEVTDENGGKNWLIVPVGADWTDNTKVLGFYNPLANNNEKTGKYEKTSIIELIERANVHPNIPYFIILDEMNLSHVERYFSDFLSHMEIPDEAFVLDGYENKVLPYPKNLFVVGTVNIDETTYMFSPKVLDRSNVIEFKPSMDDVLGLFDSYQNDTDKITPAKFGTAEAFLKLAEEIRKGKCNVEAKAMKTVKDSFEKVYKEAEKQGFEFAYRTVREIRQYVCAAKELNEEGQPFDINTVIDEQLLQKVLPKIHGNKKEIATLLDELEIICNNKENPLKLSAEKVKQMKGKLATVQYASFI